MRYSDLFKLNSIKTVIEFNQAVKILQEVSDFVQFYDIAKDLASTETAQPEFSWDE